MSVHPQIEILNKIPQMLQRSPEWFESRKMRITASEIGSVLGVNPYKSRNVFWKEKLSILRGEPEKERKYSFISEHGVKYEPVVQNIIRKRFPENPFPLYEYGMICHPTISFLGASPDGVLFDGTMVEIKCPPTRVISPYTIVPYYYSQMQLQMECCNFDRCEFIECKIYEYKNENSFMIDSNQDDIFTSADDKPKGIVGLLRKEYNVFTGPYTYYNPDERPYQNYKDWMKNIKNEFPCAFFYFYKIETFSSKMVEKNIEYIKNMIEETTIFWEDLLKNIHTNATDCQLPKPRSFLFENFILPNKLIVVYEKKKEQMQENASSESQSQKRFGFKLS